MSSSIPGDAGARSGAAGSGPRAAAALVPPAARGSRGYSPSSTTSGNTGTGHGTEVASDSTYRALDEAWAALIKAHPEREFPGNRTP
jgi:hypothetical protein